MARYDYRCPACELVFEVEHGMDEKPLIICPACGHEAARVFEVSGIALKGSGFYNTDMRDGSAPKGADRAKKTAEKAKEPSPASTDSPDSPSPSPAKGDGGAAGTD